MNKQSFNVQKNTFCKNLNNIEIADWLKGKKIEIVSTIGGHNYGPVGTKLIIGDYAYANGNGISGARKDGTGNTMTYSNFRVLLSLTEKEILSENKEIKNKIEELKSEIERNNLKIQWLKDTDNKEFSETEFKAYQTLSLMEDKKLSKVEKAKLIANLIDN